MHRMVTLAAAVPTGIIPTGVVAGHWTDQLTLMFPPISAVLLPFQPYSDYCFNRPWELLLIVLAFAFSLTMANWDKLSDWYQRTPSTNLAI